MHEQEKELFRGYEIKNWNFSPRHYKILAAAAIFNLLTLFVMGQPSMLTTRGCDSPLVGRFCQVIDTIYVSTVLLGTDSGYVDKDYVKNELADAEITYIDVSGQEPLFTYPADYFELANPESQFASINNPDFSANPIPGIPTNPTISNGMDLMNTPQVTPTPNNNAIQGNIPTEPFTLGENPIAKNPTLRNRKNPRLPKLPNNSPTKLPPLSPDTVAGNKTGDEQIDNAQIEPKSDPVTEVEINRRPIKDLGVYVNRLVNDEKAKFNLETPFVAKARGKLTKEGKLDPKTFKIEADSTDPQMIEVVRQSIEAINAAGYLQYLKGLSGKDLNLLLSQDSENITAVVQSELESDTRARSIKSALDLAISINKMKKTDPNDKDDLEILNNATVVSDGKKLIIKFAIPKPMAQEMIKRKLLEQTATTTTGPSSIVENGNTNQRTAK